MNNQLSNTLMPITEVALEAAVQIKLADKIKASQSFTAFGITLELRSENPTSLIPHKDQPYSQGVREMVHGYMNGVTTYTSTMQMQSDGQDALEYAPKPVITVDATAVPVIDQMVNAAASAVKQIAAKVGINLGFDD